MNKKIQLEGINRAIFIAGGASLSAIVIFLILLSITNSTLFLKIIGIIAASFSGGRITAIATGLELNFSNLTITLLLSSFNLSWLLIIFPFITYFYQNFVETKFFGKMLKSAYNRAQNYHRRASSYGMIALPFFIWLPFPMTGSIAGAFIGYLMGIKEKKLIVLVAFSMLVGVASWTYGFEYFLQITGKTGKIVSYVFLGILVIYSLIDRLKAGEDVESE
ncbi:MAG: small multi-drug export protein [Elusimicrobiota bacterium]